MPGNTPFKHLYLALAGMLFLSIGLAKVLAGTNIIPLQLQFNNYGWVMVGLGWLLTVPFTFSFYQAARANAKKEDSPTAQKKLFENNGHMVETSSSSENKKFDLFKMSYTLSTWLTILFGILILSLNKLTDLFPSYKGEDVIFPIFIFPSVILVLSAGIVLILIPIISKIENDCYPKKINSVRFPLNDLLYQYYAQKSYWKLLLVMICWLSSIIMNIAAVTTFFGIFIAFKAIK
jgi:hypothetical protein